jgi:diphthamide synthase (EF-2-diphthine--ammonia ligase)
MSAETTAAMERAVQAYEEHTRHYDLRAYPVIAAEGVQKGLAAALDVDAVADDMARRSSAYLWSSDHRELLVDIANSPERADAIIKESQQGVIDRMRKVVVDVRAAILGTTS